MQLSNTVNRYFFANGYVYIQKNTKQLQIKKAVFEKKTAFLKYNLSIASYSG